MKSACFFQFSNIRQLLSLMHSRPIADQLIREAKKLRFRRASEDEIEGAARILYSTNSKRDQSMRARLRNACRASTTEFAHALETYREGGNIVEIMKALPGSAAGAPAGNLNALGKKRKSSMPRLLAMWRAMPLNEQDEFLRNSNLKRNA
jgi:hypothetical protein